MVEAERRIFPKNRAPWCFSPPSGPRVGRFGSLVLAAVRLRLVAVTPALPRHQHLTGTLEQPGGPTSEEGRNMAKFKIARIGWIAMLVASAAVASPLPGLGTGSSDDQRYIHLP